MAGLTGTQVGTTYPRVLQDDESTGLRRADDGAITTLTSMKFVYYNSSGTKIISGGLTEDGSGNLSLGDGKYLATDQVRAINGDGLKLYDDGSNGIFVEDGGQIGMGITVPEAIVHIAHNNTEGSAIGATLKLETTRSDTTGGGPSIYFEDESSSGASARDWLVGTVAGGIGEFAFVRGTAQGDVPSETVLFLSRDSKVGINTSSPQGNMQWSDENTHGGLILKTYGASSGTLTADHTITIEVNVPIGVKIIGAQLHVKTALAGGETWNAQYVTGATQSIGTNQAVAQNTNLSAVFDVNTDTDIASGEVDITLQRNSNPGVDVFTAQGEIEAVVYALLFDTWDNE